VVRFESEVSGFVKMNFGVGVVALKGFCARRKEKGIMLAPHCQERGLFCAEIFLDFWVERDVAGVVEEKIELDFVVSWAAKKCGVEFVGFWSDETLVLDAVRVLPLCGLGLEEITKRGTVFGRGFFPIFLNGIPTFA